MFKVFVHPTGFAVGLTSLVVYVLCALSIWLWPDASTQFFADWFHAFDLTQLPKPQPLTLGVFLKGLIEVTIFGYLIGVLFAAIHNSCVIHCKKRGWI